MPLNKLRIVVYSLIFSRIGYALPVWGRFVYVELCCKIDAMFKRLKRYGYTTDYLTVSDLLDKADSDLFCNMRRSDHCLHHVLPLFARLITREFVVILITCLSGVVPMFIEIICFAFSVWLHITFTSCWFDSVSTPGYFSF